MLYGLIVIISTLVLMYLGYAQEGWFLCLMSGLFTCVISGLLCMLIAIPLEYPCNTKLKPYDTKYISCISDTTKINGNYFMFSCNVNQVDVYKMYINKKDGGKELITLEANKCVIYENDGVPRIEYCKKEFTGEIAKTMFGKPLSDLNTYYNIYIPKNSISNNYNIDLQ